MAISKNTRRISAATALMLVVATAGAASPIAMPGEVLNDLMDANERLTAMRSTDVDGDMNKATLLRGLMGGTVGAVQADHMMFALIGMSLEKDPDRQKILKYVRPFIHLGCMPSDSSQDQQIQVVRNYIKNNPAKWAQSGPVLILSALDEAFPCK